MADNRTTIRSAYKKITFDLCYEIIVITMCMIVAAVLLPQAVGRDRIIIILLILVLGLPHAVTFIMRFFGANDE